MKAAAGLLFVLLGVVACTRSEMPGEPLAGANEPAPPRVSPEEEGIDPAALEAAAEYAGKRNSSALIVGRRGHIVYEKYWNGTGFDTPVNTGGFNGAITAIAVGIAVDDRKLIVLDDLREQLRTDPRAVPAILEKATGQPYAEYLSQRLWKRLGAADASLSADRCCLIARQGDWMRVGQILANDGVYQGDELVAPRWVQEMVQSGLHVSRGTEAFATDDVRYLQGAGRSRLWVVPSLSLIILRTGSDPDDPQDWDETYIPNTIIHGVRDFMPRGSKPGETPIRDLVPSH